MSNSHEFTDIYCHDDNDDTKDEINKSSKYDL